MTAAKAAVSLVKALSNRVCRAASSIAAPTKSPPPTPCWRRSAPLTSFMVSRRSRRPAIELTDALGKFLPDADRPNEGVFALQDDDEQWMALRYDLTAPLARFVAQNWETPAQAVPPLRLRQGLAQREAGARPLARVRAVRRRHGGLGPPRGRRRIIAMAVDGLTPPACRAATMCSRSTTASSSTAC